MKQRTSVKGKEGTIHRSGKGGEIKETSEQQVREMREREGSKETEDYSGGCLILKYLFVTWDRGRTAEHSDTHTGVFPCL